jgi:hypothetical protein
MANQSELHDLVARQQVIETIDELFLATDRKDWAGVRAVFAPRVRFDMSSAGGGPAAERTGEEIAAVWEQGLAAIQAIHHQAGNYRVQVNGDRADAFCYGIAYHYLPKQSGRDTRVFVGSYDFELERDSGRRRITSFHYNLKFIDGNKELEKGD